MMQTEHSYTNHLATETSPYLRKHAHDPVEWYPWGGDALERARRENKPIHLSVGYTACHWCSVLHEESFEDEATARILNDNFINIKVDREERPDIDALCMEACQAMTGHGGWPLNAFLTPELVPFYAGTYFPPAQRHGMPSWRAVLDAVADAWEQRAEQIRGQSDQLLQSLGASARLEPSLQSVDAEQLLPQILQRTEEQPYRAGPAAGQGTGDAGTALHQPPQPLLVAERAGPDPLHVERRLAPSGSALPAGIDHLDTHAGAGHLGQRLAAELQRPPGAHRAAGRGPSRRAARRPRCATDRGRCRFPSRARSPDARPGAARSTR